MSHETQTVVRAYKDLESKVLLTGGAPDAEWETTHAYSKINFIVFLELIYCLI